MSTDDNTLKPGATLKFGRVFTQSSEFHFTNTLGQPCVQRQVLLRLNTDFGSTFLGAIDVEPVVAADAASVAVTSADAASNAKEGDVHLDDEGPPPAPKCNKKSKK